MGMFTLVRAQAGTYTVNVCSVVNIVHRSLLDWQIGLL